MDLLTEWEERVAERRKAFRVDAWRSTDRRRAQSLSGRPASVDGAGAIPPRSRDGGTCDILETR
jgi:hypothetical protein